MGSRNSAVLALAIVALAACGDSTDQTTPGVAPSQESPPAYITEGAKVRLNLLTPQARSRVAFKDPIQGVKNALGECEFRPDPATMRKSPYTGVVGEYDKETCAGLMYYFPPNDAPHPKPSKEDRTVLVAPSEPRASAVSAERRPAGTHAQHPQPSPAPYRAPEERAPLSAQAPTEDARDVLVASVKRAVQDANVTTVRLDDTTLTRPVAARLDARVDTGVITLPKRVTRPTAAVWSMRILPAKIRGDSAFVHVLEFTTMYNNRPFMQGSLFTLVKRDGRWVVTDASLTGIS